VVKIYPNGGVVERHNEVNTTTDDYKRILETADFFAKQGKYVLIPTRFNTPQCKDYQEVYAAFKGTEYWSKNPDLWIDGNFYEHEGYTTDNPKNTLRNMLKHGLEQSDKVVIESPMLPDSYILSRIYKRIEELNANISEVWIKEGKKLRLIYQKK
jgi:hypothetical protein